MLSNTQKKPKLTPQQKQKVGKVWSKLHNAVWDMTVTQTGSHTSNLPTQELGAILTATCWHES